jgi:hypothetical protein
MITVAFIIIFSVLSFAQENDTALNFIYHYSNSKDSLLLIGHKINETSLHIYANEFYVINCNSKDTIIFFDSLQNCIIQKKVSPLSIIETKYLPDPPSHKWGARNYLRYFFKLGSDNKIVMDSTWFFVQHIFTTSQASKIVEEYDEIKQNRNDISKELIYFILYLALTKDTWAIKTLFSMKDELKLYGSLAEVNSDAINIYKTYLKLK